MCAASLEALESLICICTQILKEQAVLSEKQISILILNAEIDSASLLGEVPLDSRALQEERITATVVQLRYLSSLGEALSMRWLFALLKSTCMILETYFCRKAEAARIEEKTYTQ